MLWTTSVILFTFWLLGILMSYTFGGYLHILVGITLAVTAIQFIRHWNDLARLKRRYKGEFRLLSDSGHRTGNAVSKRIEILAQECVVAVAKE